MACLVEARNLSKSYGPVTVLQETSFCIEKGMSILWAPNGAGKTTLIRIILGITRPDKGEIVFRKPKSIGIALEKEPVPSHATVADLILFGTLGKDREPSLEEATKILETLGLGRETLTRRIHELSTGMRRKALIAQALIGDPELIVLDEPFSGLDPASRIKISLLLNRLRDKGTDMIIATHTLSLLDPDNLYTIDNHRVKGPYHIHGTRTITAINPANGEATTTTPTQAINLYKQGYIIIDA